MLTRDLSFRSVLFTVVFISSVALPTRADTAVLTCAADTTLLEAEPDNNLGGATIVNAGTTQNFTRNRGLFRFDFSSIPRGSRVSRIDFVIEVTGQPKELQTASSFGLHRMLRSWGEGNKVSPDPIHPGLGAPATLGEATWNSPLAFTTNDWATPGAGLTNDFLAEPSAVTFVFGPGDSPYTFLSTPFMASDVQTWLDDPTSNFGWILVTESEESNFTARRFGSREDPGREPYIVVEFVPPRIDSVSVAGTVIELRFTAQPGVAYDVELSGALVSPANWQTLTNFAPQAEQTNLIASDPITDSQRFYRLRIP